MSYKTRTKISLMILLAFAGLLAFAITTRAQDCSALRKSASLGGCDNVYFAWIYTGDSPVLTQSLRYGDGFSPAISASVRNYSRTGVGCSYHVSVTISQTYASGQTCSVTEADNHNRNCSQCQGITARLATVNSASFSTSLAADALASAFSDADFTTATEYGYDADPLTPGYQLPTVLGGARAVITNTATGIQHQVGLFFISPRQVNFQVPIGLPEGLHQMTVATPDGRTVTGDVLVNRNSPGIFTLSQNGGGEASCYWIVARQGIFQNVYPGGQLQNVQPGDRVFLILFGTGVNDSRARLRLVSPNGQAAEYESLYAGDAPVFVALDQMNFEIPLADLWRGVAGAQVTVFATSGANWRSNGFTVQGLR